MSSCSDCAKASRGHPAAKSLSSSAEADDPVLNEDVVAQDRKNRSRSDYRMPAFAGMTILNIHTRNQRIRLDKHPPRLDLVAHQFVEDRIGLVDLLDVDLEHGAGVGVERGFPQLLRVHLAQPFVALQRDAFAAGRRQLVPRAT